METWLQTLNSALQAGEATTCGSRQVVGGRRPRRIAKPCDEGERPPMRMAGHLSSGTSISGSHPLMCCSSILSPAK